VWKKLLVSVLATVATLVALDVAMRLFVVPSDRSYGRLFGQELPPYRLIPWERIPHARDRLRWYAEPTVWTVRGVRLTNGDLNGILREDPILGHAPKENAVSRNGWWKANNHGARASRDIEPQNLPGKHRVFVFGDSYAHASRVPNDETWSEFLAAEDDRLEIWNFGVDGYGMGQSYLRFQLITSELDYDLALLMFVPEESLWRDVNTIRYLGQRWRSYKVNPRFVLEGDRLRLIQSPYEDLDEMMDRNGAGISDELREHLRRYDAFYIESKYEAPRIWRHSIILKRVLATLIARRERKIEERVMQPGSEALGISKKIFEAMHRDATRNGKQFCLVVLPTRTAVRRYRDEPRYARDWNAMRGLTCSGDYHCLDLMEDFSKFPRLDRGYDSSHFGPVTNRLIARLLWQNFFESRTH
jgi:hypothetical protein